MEWQEWRFHQCEHQDTTYGVLSRWLRTGTLRLWASVLAGGVILAVYMARMSLTGVLADVEIDNPVSVATNGDAR